MLDQQVTVDSLPSLGHAEQRNKALEQQLRCVRANLKDKTGKVPRAEVVASWQAGNPLEHNKEPQGMSKGGHMLERPREYFSSLIEP